VHPNYWAFAAIAVPLVLTPGASTALVLRNSIARGTRSGVRTALGINAGSLVYGVLTAFGVALALEQWPAAWRALRIGGTAYLAWLGITSIWYALGGRPSPLPRGGSRDPERSAQPLSRDLSEGFVTNLLNPSIATFYLVVVPQFVPRGAPVVRSVLMLTTLHVALAITCHVAWAAAGGTLASSLGRSGPRRALEGVTGVALLALAIRIALSA
jgi:threonine/homoserine/homoserine lactone efflux protein